MKYLPLLGALVASGVAAQPSTGDATETIVVTAGRTPVPLPDVTAAITVIDRATIDALDQRQAVDLLRLAPGVAIARSGPIGGQTQVRLRGSEANHTLVFVDGIEANDPASSNEFRWEFLPADGLERLEILRGPQSALWGSEALGGVVSAETFSATEGMSGFVSGEYGSFETLNLAAAAGLGSEAGGVSILVSHYDTDGFDSFTPAPEERDGFDNSTMTLKAHATPGSGGRIGLVARYVEGESAFDGNDPATFRRADTLDRSRHESRAIRGFAEAEPLAGWNHRMEASFVTSENANSRAGTALNRTAGDTLRTLYQTTVALSAGRSEHGFTGAAEFRAQDYRSRDNEFFGATDQDVGRKRKSLIGEYRLDLPGFHGAVALRHDDHDTFRDATTWRLAASLDIGTGVYLRGGAGEGFAAPTFTEQFGFFPGSFVGNPELKPESSVGWEVGAGVRHEKIHAEAVYFRADLEDEIVTRFDAAFNARPDNLTGKSRRQGIELSGEEASDPSG